MAAAVQVLDHGGRGHLGAQVVMRVHRQPEVAVNQRHERQGLCTERQLQLLHSLTIQKENRVNKQRKKTKRTIMTQRLDRATNTTEVKANCSMECTHADRTS